MLKVLRQQIEGQKSDLYSLNSASADPDGISARAAAQAQTLVAPQSFSPLANVFSDVLGSLGQFVNADAQRAQPVLRYNQSPVLYNSGGTSGSVVG